MMTEIDVYYHNVEKSVRDALMAIGEDPNRGGLKETPKRVARMWLELFSGYEQHPEDVLKVFEDGANGYDELVLLRDVPLVSMCEHHILPIVGVAHVGYIPNKENPRIVGLSKLARLVDVFARRLQVQERMTCQISQALMEYLNPLGAACVIEASHMCMVARGVNKHGAIMTTSSMLGVFLTKPEARAEFLSLVHGK